MVKYSVEKPSDGSINASEFIKNNQKKRKIRRKFFSKAGRTVVSFMTGRPKAKKMFSKIVGIGPKKPQKLLKNKPEFREYNETRFNDRGSYEVTLKREVHSVIFKPLRIEGEADSRDDFPPIREVESSSTKDSTIPSCVEEDDSGSETESIDFADIDDIDICDDVVNGSDYDNIHHNDQSRTASLSLAENIQSPDVACQEVVDEKMEEQVICTTTDVVVPESNMTSNLAQSMDDPYHDDNDGKFDICKLSLLRFVKSFF